MNINTERCSRCNRRQFLTTGYFRRLLKPVECNHSQRQMENSVTNILTESKGNSVNGSNKFVVFWKKKVFCSSLRSIQRYFVNKVNNENIIHVEVPKSSLSEICCDSIEKKYKSSSMLSLNHDSSLCEHPSGHSVLRGHHQHPTPESCAVYCQLSKHGWYWGGITSREAEELLAGQHDNVFLVRDSYNSRHLLCVSFRCVGRTLHARLRHANGLFSLNNETFVSANSLSEHCASVAVKPGLLETPVRLARPLNRFAKLDSLQMICRFVIRQSTPREHLNSLPLPQHLIRYVMCGSDYIIPSNLNQ